LDDFELPPIRQVVWIGTSKKNLQSFPKGVQKLIGDELQLIQYGEMPANTKPFKGIGSGIFEIAIRYATDAYRAVLAVQLGEKIYILHAFQKKAKKGISTPKKDMDLIRQRYNEAKELAKDEQ
jgi:phage-related protein